jgi:uncharacterized protein Yka (UPF0111/DUF47 family)
MSGSSLNYLYSRNIGIDDMEYLADAMEYLEELGQELTSAYKDLYELYGLLETISEKQEKLSNILHDIEWTISGDYSDEQLLESINKYESNT